MNGAAVAPDAALHHLYRSGHRRASKHWRRYRAGDSAGGGRPKVLTIIARTITVAFQSTRRTRRLKRQPDGASPRCTFLPSFPQAMRIAIPAVIAAISVGTSEVQGMLNAIPEVVTGGLKYRRQVRSSGWVARWLST